MDPLAFYMLPILALVVAPVFGAAARRLAALAFCLSLGFCATIDQEPIHVLTSDGFNLPTAIAFPF